MNHFKWLALVSALVLAIGFTACSNDDEKKQGGITYADIKRIVNYRNRVRKASQQKIDRLRLNLKNDGFNVK